jgi:hypothetical protein
MIRTVAAAAMRGESARWLDDEIDDLFVVGPKLPAAARRAVCSVLEALLAEGMLDARQVGTANALRRSLLPRSLDARLEQRDHVIGVGVAPEHRLREHELAGDVDVEDAVGSRHDLDGADAFLKVLENARRQTDSVRTRPSGDAVLDPDRGQVSHGVSLL